MVKQIQAVKDYPKEELRVAIANKIYGTFATAEKNSLGYLLQSCKWWDVEDAIATYIESRFDFW